LSGETPEFFANPIFLECSHGYGTARTSLARKSLARVVHLPRLRRF
jgi:hypothetical protein